MNDIQLENKLLHFIFRTKKIPPGLHVDFFTDGRRVIYVEMVRQWNEFREVDKNLFKSVDFPDIFEVLESIDSYSQAMADQLRTLWLDRKYYEVFDSTRAIEDPRERLNAVRKQISETEITSTVPYSQPEEVLRLIDIMALNQTTKKEISGYSTGIVQLDRIINGIEKGKMYLLGGLKKTGKSRFMVYLALNAIKQGARVFVNSLEMNSYQLNTVALAYFSGVDSQRVMSGMSHAEYSALLGSFGQLNDLDWCVYREYSPDALQSRVEWEKTRHPVDMVVVDFAQRMRAEKYKNDRVREVEHIAQRLADMSRDLNVAVILLSQLSGMAEHLKDDETPNMSHYKESQGLPENADCILTLHNPNRNHPAYNQDAYIIQQMTLKVEQRYGLSGVAIGLAADLRTAKFEYCQAC